ncbi:DeoR family transcriptional regulator, partial [Patescibacteria group bacterium]
DVYEEEYIEAWKQAAGESDDITLWIERFIRNFASEIKDTRESIEKLIQEYQEKNKQPFLNLNRRQLKILRYLQNIPQVKREEYVEMMDVSTMTAYRDLTELVRKGLLRLEGQGRGTRYMLVNR